ncbi:MAG: hypothetical protein HY739_10215 [Desulfobacterales bacterium]|nr:hypothetical protein [Desulfobacterales bacterium]
MKYWVLEILKSFSIPFILIIVTVFFIFNSIDVKNQETSRLVLGVMLGIILGFSADLTKRGLDDLLKKQKFRKISLKLLEEDAKSIYRIIWSYDRMMKSPNTPPELKGHIPAELKLKYWANLKENNEFLMLGVEDPFNKIFEEMWNFEQINEQISLAKQGNQQAAIFARTFYKLAADEQSHKKLLLFFKSEKEIEELDKKYIDVAKERHKKEIPGVVVPN